MSAIVAVRLLRAQITTVCISAWGRERWEGGTTVGVALGTVDPQQVVLFSPSIELC